MEVPTYGFTRPPKGNMDNSKPLVVTYNMEKHDDLLLYCTIDAISQQAPSTKQITKLEERSPSHPKQMNTMGICGVVDKAQVFMTLYIPL